MATLRKTFRNTTESHGDVCNPHIHIRTRVMLCQEFYLVSRGILYTSFRFFCLCAVLAGRPQNIADGYQSRTSPAYAFVRVRVRVPRASAGNNTAKRRIFDVSPGQTGG